MNNIAVDQSATADRKAGERNREREQRAIEDASFIFINMPLVYRTPGYARVVFMIRKRRYRDGRITIARESFFQHKSRALDLSCRVIIIIFIFQTLRTQ